MYSQLLAHNLRTGNEQRRTVDCSFLPKRRWGQANESKPARPEDDPGNPDVLGARDEVAKYAVVFR